MKIPSNIKKMRILPTKNVKTTAFTNLDNIFNNGKVIRRIMMNWFIIFQNVRKAKVQKANYERRLVHSSS